MLRFAPNPCSSPSATGDPDPPERTPQSARQPVRWRSNASATRIILHFIVSGELDRVTACQLKQQCGRVDHEEIDTVLLDLAEVTFMDSSGLEVLPRRTRTSGERLVIIIGPSCAHAIDIAGARDQLPIIEG